MSETNINNNPQGITKDEFKKSLGYKDDSQKLKKALSIFDNYDKDNNQVLDKTEQDEIKKALKSIDKNKDDNIAKREVRSSNNAIFKDAGIIVSQKAMNTLNQLIVDSPQEPSQLPKKAIESKPLEPVSPVPEKVEQNLIANHSSVMEYLMGEDIQGVDISKEIKFSDNGKSLEFSGKKFDILQNGDSITFVHEFKNGDENVYLTLQQMIADSSSDDKANKLFNRGDVINKEVKYDSKKIISNNSNAVRQEQTIAAAMLNSNEHTTLKLNNQKTNNGQSEITDGLSMVEFIDEIDSLGKKDGLITKQELINFLMAVKKDGEDADSTPARRFAKDIDIDVKDLVNINAVFNHYSGKDGVLSPDEFTALIEDLKKSNMAKLAKNLIKPDSYEPPKPVQTVPEIVTVTPETIQQEVVQPAAIPTTEPIVPSEETIMFHEKEPEKTFGRVDAASYTDFEARQTYLENRYGDNTKIRISTSMGDGTTRTDINDDIVVYRSDKKFKVITKDRENQFTNTNITNLYKGGLFTVSNCDRKIETVNGKRKFNISETMRYYLKNGKEVSEQEFYETLHNFNPDFVNENSQVTYSNGGIEYKGDNYSITQQDKIINIKNNTKNKDSQLDLDFLLRDIESLDTKTKLMALIQTLPGEVLEDLSGEINRILLKYDESSRVAGYYANDEIVIDSSVLAGKTNALRGTLLHELGHSVDENGATDANYRPEVEKVFQSEVSVLNEKLGGTFDELGYDSYADLVKERINKNAVSGYAAKDISENFAERYAHIMSGFSNSQEILEYFPKTFERQISHLNTVRSSTPMDKIDINGSFRMDQLIKPNMKFQVAEVEQDSNNFVMTVFNGKNSDIPTKIIKFSSDNRSVLDNNRDTILKTVADVVPTEMIEYSLTNPDVAYRTTIDSTNNAVKIERIERPQ